MWFLDTQHSVFSYPGLLTWRIHFDVLTFSCTCLDVRATHVLVLLLSLIDFAWLAVNACKLRMSPSFI